MSESFDVEKEFELATRFKAENLPLKIVEFPEELICQLPGSSIRIHPGVLSVVDGFVAGIRINGDYIVFVDHPKHDSGSAMRLAGIIALAAATSPDKLLGD